MANLFGDSIVLPKASGKGILVDHTAPTYGWADMIGPIVPKAFGAGTPTRAVYRGNIYQFSVGANDEIDCQFHIPHDYAPGTDLYLHVHHGHNGTNISGTAEWTCYTSYAKRDTGVYPAQVAPLLSHATVNLTTTPQYGHIVTETQISAASPSGTQIDTDDIETDGVILVTAKLTTAPTVTGGSWFVFFLDIHYQTTNVGTKNRASPFHG